MWFHWEVNVWKAMLHFFFLPHPQTMYLILSFVLSKLSVNTCTVPYCGSIPIWTPKKGRRWNKTFLVWSNLSAAYIILNSEFIESFIYHPSKKCTTHAKISEKNLIAQNRATLKFKVWYTCGLFYHTQNCIPFWKVWMTNIPLGQTNLHRQQVSTTRERSQQENILQNKDPVVLGYTTKIPDTSFIR